MQTQQIVVTGQNQVELQDRELDDERLDSDELLIETENTYISAGTELANYTGKDPDVFRPGTWCAYPWSAGYANVGVIRAVGDQVATYKPGDRVFTYGPHSSAIRYCQTELVIAVPEDLDPAVAAASRMAGVALAGVVGVEMEYNPWVVVFGLGAIGNLAAQAFRIRGGRVIGVDPVCSRRDLAEACGIPYAIGGSENQVQEAIKEITGGKMADITVDAVGHTSVVRQALDATASFGELILLGTPRVAVQGNITEILNEIHMRMITLRGRLEWGLPIYPDVGRKASQFSKQEMIFDCVQRGELMVEPLISHHMKPERIKEAYEGLLHQPDTYVGVVLDWR